MAVLRLGEHERGLGYCSVRSPRAISSRRRSRARRSSTRCRGRRDFIALMSEAETNRGRALDAFREAGGERLLGA